MFYFSWSPREIEKAVMNVDVNYLREVIVSFLRRVYSFQRHDGELVIEELS